MSPARTATAFPRRVVQAFERRTGFRVLVAFGDGYEPGGRIFRGTLARPGPGRRGWHLVGKVWFLTPDLIQKIKRIKPN